MLACELASICIQPLKSTGCFFARYFELVTHGHVCFTRVPVKQVTKRYLHTLTPVLGNARKEHSNVGCVCPVKVERRNRVR